MSSLRNPILAAAEEEIEADISPVDREVFLKLTIAAMSVALKGGNSSAWGVLPRKNNPVAASADLAFRLVAAADRDGEHDAGLELLKLASEAILVMSLAMVSAARSLPISRGELMGSKKRLDALLDSHRPRSKDCQGVWAKPASCILN